MANIEHFEIIQKGIHYWNQWRDEKPEIVPDLSEANLGAEIISGKIISGINLKSGGVAAFEKVLDNPLGAFMKGAWEGWEKES